MLLSGKIGKLTTARTIGLIDKLIVAQLAKKVRVLYKNQVFVTAFIAA